MNISMPDAFGALIESNKRYRIAVGGRGSTNLGSCPRCHP